MKGKGYVLRDIARALQRSISTISDEIRRNAVKGIYEPKKAQHKAYVRRKYAKYQVMKIVEHPSLRMFVERALRERRSPESIAGRIRTHERQLPAISADSIERFLRSVHGRKIEAYRRKMKRRRRCRRRMIQHPLPQRTFIEKRPRWANERRRVGDAEADLIVSGRGGRGVLLVVVDRRLRTTFIERVLPVSIANVHAAFRRIKERYPEMITLTLDNDILFRKHKELAALLGVKIYFCHPYHSWEKGTVENANKEIRKNVPKGSDISTYSKGCIRTIEEKLNSRYMEVLGHATPSEVLLAYRIRKKRRGGDRKKCSD